VPDLASLPVSADDIRAAERILEGVVRPTPLEYSRALSAKVAQAKIAAGDADPIYAEKLILARYYMQRILPEAGAHLAKLKAGAELVMALSAEAF